MRANLTRTTSMSKKRITLVTQFFPPETFAGANRVGAMADVLADSHELVVVAPRPGYPHASLYDPLGAVEADRGRAYRVVRSRPFRPHSRSLPVRAVRELMMATRLAVLAAREPSDIVVTSSPSMFLGPVCLVLARARSSRFVWDIRDIGWDYAGESTLASIHMGVALGALQRVMWFVAGRADLVVTASEGGARRVGQNGVGRTQVLNVENVASRDLLESCADCRERVPKPRPIVSYVGLIGDAQGLAVMVDVAKALPDVDFVIAGDGPERALLEARIAELQVTNVTLTGYLSRAEVLDLYRRSDVLFAQLRDAPTLNATSLPSKLYEYMATGKPIVYAGSGLAAETVERIGCGIRVPAGAGGAIATGIRELLDDESKIAEMGRTGRAYVDAGGDRETAFMALADRLSALE